MGRGRVRGDIGLLDVGGAYRIVGIIFGLGWVRTLRRVTSEVGGEDDRLCDDVLLLEGGCGKRGGRCVGR